MRPGPSRPTLSCLAAVVFVAVVGWHAADHGGNTSSAVATSSLLTTGAGRLDDILPMAPQLGDRSAVAEQVALKQVELERLAAVAAAAVAVLLLLVGWSGALGPERPRRGRLDRSALRSRGPPPAFVS